MGINLEKGPISLGAVSPICNLNNRTPLLHFSDDQIASLNSKIGSKNEKNCTFVSILHQSLHF